MLDRILAVVRKEVRQTLRERRMRLVLFVPPLIQLLIFGFAVNLDVDVARIAWMDGDGTPASRELREAFAGSPRFLIAATPASGAELDRMLDRGEVQAAVSVLAGFEADLRRGRTAHIQLLVDGSNSNTAAIVAGYATQAASHLAASPVRTRVWFNPDLQSRIYFVPGVIVNILLLVTVMLTSMAIVREKEIGTMEQLLVTPIRPIELIAGKALPFTAMGFVNLAFITTAAHFVFAVPIRGSLPLLAVCALLFLMTALGVGLFVSTVSETQQQAMMSSFLFFMPAFMLSGFAFPVRNMPAAAQAISYLNPLRYFLEIVRGIFLKGSGVNELWTQMAALAVFGVLILSASALRFRKRLD